jgi:hypothetical protein
MGFVTCSTGVLKRVPPNHFGTAFGATLFPFTQLYDGPGRVRNSGVFLVSVVDVSGVK